MDLDDPKTGCMNIAWYTPFSNHSAIGHFSRLVVDSLRQQQVQVDIVRCDQPNRQLPPLETDAPVLLASQLDRQLERRMQDYDLVVYNMGDHFPNHAWCIRHQARVPGVTILHDYSLHHALNGYCVASQDPDAYRQYLLQEAGPEALRVLESTCGQQDEGGWWREGIARFPVYRWALRGTYGVVTHADFYCQIVQQRLGCPVTKIPLAYDTPADLAQGSSELKPGVPLTVLTVGTVNPNKRSAAVIHAIANSPGLRRQWRYRIVGSIEPGRRRLLEQIIERHGPPLDVSILGRVDEQTLQGELAQAHVLACLRHPPLEGGSASVVQAMLSGKPTIVSDTGCYREIPSHLVYKIDPQQEQAQLQRCLQQLVRDYPAALRRARYAREWALAQHSPQQYAQRFLQFADHILSQQPVLRMVDRVAQYMRAWEMAADPTARGRLEQAIDQMFLPPAAETARRRAA